MKIQEVDCNDFPSYKTKKLDRKSKNGYSKIDSIPFSKIVELDYFYKLDFEVPPVLNSKP